MLLFHQNEMDLLRQQEKQMARKGTFTLDDYRKKTSGDLEPDEPKYTGSRFKYRVIGLI